MTKTRLEAFSDGVLAIIITIMVLELRVPQSSDWSELRRLLPVFTSYFLSFMYIGIYWGNHHHLLHSVKHISSGMILANLNLLFWLSLVPFATGWMGANHFAPNTIAVYGLVLTLSGGAFYILLKVVERHAQDIDALKTAFRILNRKGIFSQIGYFSSIPLAYVDPWISGILYLVISVVWLIPDINIERALKTKD